MYDLLLIRGSFSVCLYSQRRKWCNDCSDARRHEKRKGKRSRESDHRLLCYEGNYRMKKMWTVEIQIQMKIWSSQWQLQIKPDKENFETSTSTGSNPVESWARIPLNHGLESRRLNCNYHCDDHISTEKLNGEVKIKKLKQKWKTEWKIKTKSLCGPSSAIHIIFILFHSFHALRWTQQLDLFPMYGSS